MTAELAAPIALPTTIPSMSVVDLFSLDDPIHPSHRKRPCPDDDPDTIRFQAEMTEEEELELVLRRLR